MPEDEFVQMLLLAAEVCGRPTPTKKLCQLYFSKFKTVESTAIRKAIDAFATRGKWPTLAELMHEVGLVPPPTRQEREAAETRALNHEVAYDELPTGREITEYGRWVFRSEAERLCDLDAKRKGLEDLGWCVWMTRDFSVMKQRKTGNQTKMQRMFLRDHFAFRFPPEVPQEAIDAYRRLLCTHFATK
jgi:hypothetical protein